MGEFDWLGKIPQKKESSNKVFIEGQIIEKDRPDVATIPYGGVRYHGVYKVLQGNKFVLLPQERYNDIVLDTGVTANTNYVSVDTPNQDQVLYITDVLICIDSTAATTATEVSIGEFSKDVWVLRPAGDGTYSFHFKTPLKIENDLYIGLTVGTSNTVNVLSVSLQGFIEGKIT